MPAVQSSTPSVLNASAYKFVTLDDLPALAPYLPEVDVLDELAEQGRG